MNMQSETHSPQPAAGLVSESDENNLPYGDSPWLTAGNFNRFFLEIRWGAKSLVSLYLSVISGIVVALQYDLAAPFYSTGSLESLIPFGQFWRSLHYYSSQFFFIFLLVHLAVVLIDKRLFDPGNIENGAHLPAKSRTGKGAETVLDHVGRWLMLTLSLPIAALILFTGYILRFDGTGESAGLIAENITRAVPFFGQWLNSFLFNISSGLKVVYANHVIGLGCLWGYLAWSHLRKYRVRLQDHGSLLVAVLVISFFFAAPIEPAWPGNFHVLGPWFFIGLQELLKYLQPFLAGVIFPVAGMILLSLAVLDQGRWRWPMIWTAVWCAIYVVLTVVGWVGLGKDFAL